MASGKFGKEREIWCWLYAEWRDGHEPGKRQGRGPNSFDELAHLADRAAALLLLVADVDLHIKRWSADLSVRFLERFK